MSRIPLLAGNWKMHKTISEAVALTKGLAANLKMLSGREVLICPPFTALHAVAQAAAGSVIKVGAQNLYWETKGAFTGEIAPGMLTEAGCSFVLVGHSERRQFFGETDATVNRRMKAAFAAGLIPVVCVGETLEEREGNVTSAVVTRQVTAGLAGISPEQSLRVVVAYEPVWAIGTGRTATPAQAQEVHALIRSTLSAALSSAAAAAIRVLYGGSVKPENTAELMSQPDIDGALVGGASLDLDSFTRIVDYR